MAEKLPITLLILTKDEEPNLEYCLKSSAEHVERIVIVDSDSADATVAIARRYGSDVYNHRFKNHAEQFNWALDNIGISSDWILRLDADEVVSEELWEEIGAALRAAPEDLWGFFLKRRVYFMGRWIRHGGYYPTWILRLFRNGKGRYEDRVMDEHIILSGGKTAQLQNDFKDENHKSLSWWLDKHRDYARREAQAMLAERKSGSRSVFPGGQPERKRWAKNNLYLRLPIFIRPFIYFLYRYFLRAGFLDGFRGSIFHVLQGFWYRFLVDVNYFKLSRSRTDKK